MLTVTPLLANHLHRIYIFNQKKFKVTTVRPIVCSVCFTFGYVAVTGTVDESGHSDGQAGGHEDQRGGQQRETALETGPPVPPRRVPASVKSTKNGNKNRRKFATLKSTNS